MCKRPRTAAQIVVFYSLLFFVPPLFMLFYTRGQTQLTREELLKSPAARERVPPRPQPFRMAALPHPPSPPAWQLEQMKRNPDLIQEKKDQMDAVLFKTKASMQTDWAEKRERERQQKAQSSNAPS